MVAALPDLSVSKFSRQDAKCAKLSPISSASVLSVYSVVRILRGLQASEWDRIRDLEFWWNPASSGKGYFLTRPALRISLPAASTSFLTNLRTFFGFVVSLLPAHSNLSLSME